MSRDVFFSHCLICEQHKHTAFSVQTYGINQSRSAKQRKAEPVEETQVWGQKAVFILRMISSSHRTHACVCVLTHVSRKRTESSDLSEGQ